MRNNNGFTGLEILGIIWLVTFGINLVEIAAHKGRVPECRYARAGKPSLMGPGPAQADLEYAPMDVLAQMSADRTSHELCAAGKVPEQLISLECGR